MCLYFPCYSCNWNRSCLSPCIQLLFSLTVCLCISFSKINIFWMNFLCCQIWSYQSSSDYFMLQSYSTFAHTERGGKFGPEISFTPPLKWLWTAQFFKQILLYKVCSPEKPPSPRLDSRPTVAHCAPALAPSWGVLLPPRDQPWEC